MPRTRPPADPVKVLLDTLRPPKRKGGPPRYIPPPKVADKVPSKEVCDTCGQYFDPANAAQLVHRARAAHMPMTRAAKKRGRWRR